MNSAQTSYDALITELKEIALLSSVASVLHWDERTQMPPRGAEHRASQLSLLARMTHERFTSPKIGQWLGEVESSPLVKEEHGDATVNVRETRRAYERATKLPSSLVEELTRTEVLGQQAWAEARKESRYATFEPWLEKILKLKHQQAECLGDVTGREGPDWKYNALMDDFEPRETTENLVKVFASLRDPLAELVRKIASSPRQAPVQILERRYPAAAQEKLSREASAAAGFDFSAGRLDTSLHPFCTGLGPGDTRLTTRYDENYFGDAFFGVLHETGHGLYDQGLPHEHFGTPCGEAISLGIHESQSRMWENFVGRSRSFWQHFFPKARTMFPEALEDVSLEQWHFAVNNVRPSLIRTESDETTYNLHVLLRFELEQAMMRGQLTPRDIPAAWNAKMNDLLGVTPPDDARGCLQDIHWSSGGIGYFPTYTLGNLYAAQFFEQARQDLGDLDALFARGDFKPLLDWLRQNIHRHGKRYTAAQLVQKVTGKPLSAEPLLRHLRKKANELYEV